MTAGLRLCSMACLALTTCFTASARLDAADASAPVPAAMVGRDTVYVEEAMQVLEDSHLTEKALPEALPKLQAEALEQVINRRLVARQLAAQGYEPAPEQVDDLLAELKQRLNAQQLAAQQLPFDEFLKRRHLTEALVRRQLAWEWTWNRYLEQQLTDAELTKFFDGRRREFDGTELRVSHILLKVGNLADRVEVAAAVKQAERLRGEILAKTISFAAAAEKHSAGPSRRQGGDLGFIPRHGAMAEAFSRAAFQLQPGEVSEPVVSPFGVHLIECTGVKAGEETWQMHRRELAEAWARERFLELAEAARKKTPVRYAGAMPHFQSGTQQIVMPGPSK